jgi:hypothetical protein
MKHLFSLIIAFVLLLLVSCESGQSISNGGSIKNNVFESFLCQFNKINQDNAQLSLISPEIAGYTCKIDSSYFQFVDKVPYFSTESVFRIDIHGGYILGIEHYYANDFVDIQFLKIYIFNQTGEVLDKIDVPYIHSVGSKWYDRWYVLVSQKDIYCLSKSKPNNTHLECEGVHYSIEQDSLRFIRNPETHFSLPLFDDADRLNYGD